MKPDLRPYITYRLERARDTMAEAQTMLAAGHLHGAVNRLYYACFYSVSALLLCEGRSASKHTGVRALFEEHWVKTRRVSVDRGRFYHKLFDHRQKADYDDFVSLESAEVRSWLDEASAFVGLIAGLVEQQLGKETEPPPE